jgi:hypothetical protein
MPTSKNPSEDCIKQRIKRNGSNIVKKPGRPVLSVSHKKKTRQNYLIKMKNEKIKNGTLKPVGRPKKIQNIL